MEFFRLVSYDGRRDGIHHCNETSPQGTNERLLFVWIPSIYVQTAAPPYSLLAPGVAKIGLAPLHEALPQNSRQ